MMTLIETVTLTSSASSIEFTSIPQDGVDLLLVTSARSTSSGDAFAYYVRFNNDTGSNYSLRSLEGSGSSVSSASLSGNNRNYAGYSSGASSTSNTYGNSALYISNYTSSTAKSSSLDAVSENNATSAIQLITAQSWTGTASIASMIVYTFGTTFVAGSTASLYKIS